MITLSVVSILFILGLSCGKTVKSRSPIGDSGQVILVIALTDSTSKATLSTFSRTGKGWRETSSCPVVIGKNGMGWGIGLHSDSDINPAEPVKREGDGKTPMGVFDLVHAYGYLPREEVDTRIPYTQSGADLICVDDAGSEHYAMVVSSQEKGLDPDNLPSHETMLRRDHLYKFTILVGHNTTKPERGAGSCIFLHLWGGEDSHTAGCTAMSEADMVRLLSRIDPAQHPVLVQLTLESYERLRDRWGLPDITR